MGALLTGGGDLGQPGTAPRRVVAVVAEVKLESAVDEARPQGFLLSVPLAVATVLGAVLAAAAGMLYLDSFVDAVDPLSGLALPLVAAVLLSLLVTALAVLRHLRLAWRLQPAQALQ